MNAPIVSKMRQRGSTPGVVATTAEPTARTARVSVRPGPQALVSFWVLLSAFCAVAGWALSAWGELNARGYTIAFVVGLGLLGVAAVRSPLWRQACVRGQVWARLVRRRRWTRSLPRIYLALFVLAGLGGVLYPPSNYDALTYRIPRVLHWWAAGQWHWIATPIIRMDYSATGFEWLMAPLIVLLHTDRLVFLPNLVAYLLLPGLVFSVFRQLGVSPRVAWYWMWIVPAGYCFIMQAGSAGNDAYAAVYALAAVYFACRATQSRRVQDLWLAGLAAALLTGSKASNLPLLLPCLLAALPALYLLRTRVVATAGVALVAALVSFAPVFALNMHFASSWTGDTTGDMQIKNPLDGLLGNSLQLLPESFSPPVLPFAGQIGDQLVDHLPNTVRAVLDADLPGFKIELGELPQEERSGLGFGVSILVLLALGAPPLVRSTRALPGLPVALPRRGLLVGAGAGVAGLFFMCVMGSNVPARLLTPYYPLLILLAVLHPANRALVRQRWWKAVASACAASALVGLVLTPSRPLWPAGFVTERLLTAAPHNAQVARIAQVYAVYAQRHDVLGPLRADLPPDVRTIGFIGGENDSEVALWQPFGSRQVVPLDPGSRALAADGAPQWVVVKEDVFGTGQPGGFEAWLAQQGGRVVARERITSVLTEGPKDWAVVEIGR